MPTIETTNLKLLAVLIAARVKTELYRNPSRPHTVIGSFSDTPATRTLIDNYERRMVLPVPQKNIMQAYVELGYECKRLVMEAI
jgi:hypothetical protein